MCACTDLWESWAGNRPGPPGGAEASRDRGNHERHEGRERGTEATPLFRSRGRRLLVNTVPNFQFLRSERGRLLVNGLADFQFGEDPDLAADAAGPGGWAGSGATDRFVGDMGRYHGRVRALSDVAAVVRVRSIPDAVGHTGF